MILTMKCQNMPLLASISKGIKITSKGYISFQEHLGFFCIIEDFQQNGAYIIQILPFLAPPFPLGMTNLAKI